MPIRVGGSCLMSYVARIAAATDTSAVKSDLMCMVETHQCRKCRIPVNTIANPAASAAAITSASRIDPPG